MPLSDTGKRNTTLEATNALAKDQNDRSVTVRASSGAIEDYGWSQIWSVASRKYDADDFEIKSGQPIVTVKTTDCAN